MTSVAVIGAGDLGGAVAHALAMRETAARVLLIDERATVAAGKALDIQQGGAISGSHTRVEGTADLSRAVGCGVCVIADHNSPSVDLQGDEGASLLAKLLGYAGDAPLVFAGTRQTELMQHAAQVARVAPERLIGSATEALRSAVRAIVAVEARCAPSEVTLQVLGAPPDGVVVPWSEASIGGQALERVLSAVQLQRIEARTGRLWPPGPYALGAAGEAVVRAIVTCSPAAFSVLTPLDGEFRVRGRIGAIAGLFGPSGIVVRRTPTLTTREQVRIETALGGAFA